MNKVYNKKMEEILPLYKNKVDLIITDPPYGVNATQKGDYIDDEHIILPQLDKWFNFMFQSLKDSRHIYVFVPNKNLEYWLISFKKYFTLNNILTAENMKTGRRYKNKFRNNNQLILFGSKGKAKPFNQYDWIKTSESWFKDKRNPNPQEFVYSYPSYIPNYIKATIERQYKFNGTGHNDEKNTKLLKAFIGISSNENDLVLDPFAGSGSTLISAKELNRNYVGCEINKDYYNLIVSRIKGE